MGNYFYDQAGRRAEIWAGLCVTAVLLLAAMQHNAPILVWALWAGTAIFFLYLMVANPRVGVRLTQDKLRYWVGGSEHVIALDNIDYVRIEDSRDAIFVYLYLRNGGQTRLFREAVSPARSLEKALLARGLSVVRG